MGLIQSFSPALVRLRARAAAKEGCESASEDLLAQAGVAIEGRQIQRLVNLVAPAVAAQLEAGGPASADPIPILYAEVDGTGVPMVAEELAGRPGKQEDGSAQTREVKLGAIFTQTQTDAEELPVRDHQSTTSVGGFESAPDLGIRLRAEARRRGLGRAAKVVFIGDGAAWIWELARVNFPLAILILDLYHALERLHELCDGLYGADTPWATRMKPTWTAMLKHDRVGEVIAAARRRLGDLGPQADDSLEKQIAYFEHHQDKMRYQTYRERGLFYGSGVIEGGCKPAIGQRLEESGMFWTEKGARSVLTLRVALKSHRWDECWDRLHDSHYLKNQIRRLKSGCFAVTHPQANCGCCCSRSHVGGDRRAWRYVGSHRGSADVERRARSSQRRSSGSRMSSSVLAARVVSSFSPVAWPAPTKNPASRSDTRNIVLRE